MSKASDLETLPRAALKEAATWLWFQGRVESEMSGWLKEDYIELLERKLSRDDVTALLDVAGDSEPFFDDHDLGRILGLPQKERVLENASKAELQVVMEALEQEDRCEIAWRSRNADQLRDYLRKFTRAEVARLLWDLDLDERDDEDSDANEDDGEEHREHGDDEDEDVVGPAENLIGGRYRLNRLIGKGGFGEAWEATDVTNSKRGAVVLKFAHDEDTDLVSALEQEFQIAAKLTHPNICRYWDRGADEKTGRVFLVMEHCGQSIEDRIDGAGDFSVEHATRIVSEAAVGLDFAHERMIVHLDINPGNVLVKRDPIRGVEDVRIADFGISAEGTRQRTERGGSTLRVSVVGFHLGYAAPEVLARKGRSRSDQYSLARLFCSMIDGAIYQGPFPFREIRRLNRKQNAVLRRALSHRAGDRFDSCRDFTDALHQAGP